MITDQQKREWLYNLSNLPVRRWPFAHCILEQTIPADLYARMQAKMPPHEEFVPLHSTGRIGKGTYPERFIYDPDAWQNSPMSNISVQRKLDLWRSIRAFLLSRDFALALARPYRDLSAALQRNPDAWVMDTLLIEDLPGYRIGPHADAPHKVLSALFYLGNHEFYRDHRVYSWGTSLYQPKPATVDIDPQSGRHYEFADFDRIATMPYRYNHGLSFLKSDTSWHGVEQIPAIAGERRIVLLADIKLRR